MMTDSTSLSSLFQSAYSNIRNAFNSNRDEKEEEDWMRTWSTKEENGILHSDIVSEILSFVDADLLFGMCTRVCIKWNLIVHEMKSSVKLNNIDRYWIQHINLITRGKFKNIAKCQVVSLQEGDLTKLFGTENTWNNLECLILDKCYGFCVSECSALKLPRLASLSITRSHANRECIIELLKNFPKLERLDCKDTPFTGEHLKEICNVPMEYLIHFNISKSNIAGKAIEYVANGKFFNLQELVVDGSGFGNFHLNLLSQGNIELTLLSLATNEVDDNGVSYLLNSKFSKLASLNLSNNKVTIEGIRTLSKLSQLRELIMYGSSIDDDMTRIISNGQLSELTSLDLTYNLISNQGANYLANGNITKLTKLKLGFNDLSLEGANELTLGNLHHLQVLHLNDNKIPPKLFSHPSIIIHMD